MEKVKCRVVGQIYGNDGKPLELGTTVMVPVEQLAHLKHRVEQIVDEVGPDAEIITGKDPAPKPDPKPDSKGSAPDIAGQAPTPPAIGEAPAPWAAPASAPEKGGKK
jgi:hypothetical protein